MSFRLFLAALACGWLALSPGRGAWAQEAPEGELKAAILFNLLAFVEWPAPAAPGEPLLLCHAGGGPVAAALLRLQGRSVRGRPLQIEPYAGERSCAALYVAAGETALMQRLTPALRTSGLLVLSDAPGLAGRGVMVSLALEGGRVVFDVDLRFARLAGLTFSSKVLRLARTVWE